MVCYSGSLLGGKSKTEESTMSDKEQRGPGKRIWNQYDPATSVLLPLIGWPEAEPIRQTTLRVSVLISDSLFQVTDQHGNTWEVSREADGALTIVYPESVSGPTKKKVLAAVRREITPNR